MCRAYHTLHAIGRPGTKHCAVTARDTSLKPDAGFAKEGCEHVGMGLCPSAPPSHSQSGSLLPRRPTSAANAHPFSPTSPPSPIAPCATTAAAKPAFPPIHSSLITTPPATHAAPATCHLQTLPGHSCVLALLARATPPRSGVSGDAEAAVCVSGPQMRSPLGASDATPAQCCPRAMVLRLRHVVCGCRDLCERRR